MTTYVLIDIRSGYIAGTAEAETALEAAKALDEATGMKGREYDTVPWGPYRPANQGYDVYIDETGREWTTDDHEIAYELPLARTIYFREKRNF